MAQVSTVVYATVDHRRTHAAARTRYKRKETLEMRCVMSRMCPDHPRNAMPPPKLSSCAVGPGRWPSQPWQVRKDRYRSFDSTTGLNLPVSYT